MIIEAVMYGATPKRTMEIFDSPPPEKILRSPKKAFSSKSRFKANTSTPGSGMLAIRR